VRDRPIRVTKLTDSYLRRIARSCRRGDASWSDLQRQVTAIGRATRATHNGDPCCRCHPRRWLVSAMATSHFDRSDGGDDRNPWLPFQRDRV